MRRQRVRLELKEEGLPIHKDLTKVTDFSVSEC